MKIHRKYETSRSSRLFSPWINLILAREEELKRKEEEDSKNGVKKVTS